MRYFECGSCGEFHREDYWGDCRNDEERFDIDELEKKSIEETGDLPDIVWLDFQEDEP